MPAVIKINDIGNNLSRHLNEPSKQIKIDAPIKINKLPSITGIF